MEAKRLFDLVASGAALYVASPLLATIAVAIKLDDGGPILYRGQRVGRFGRPFAMLKFRTMGVDAERHGPSSTANDDPRITRVGRLLRRYKLDELPQLFNVLAGEMSIVGPRPQVAWAVERYAPEERVVLDVRPGITDRASLRFANEGEILKGSLDPDRDYWQKIHPEKMRLALEYVRHQSLAEDLRIIAQTARALLGKGSRA